MKNNKRKINNITVALVGIIGIVMIDTKVEAAYKPFRNAVIIDKNGVIPDLGITSTTNNNSTIEKANSATTPVKPEDKKPQGNAAITKPVVESGKEKSGVKLVEKESGNKADEKQVEKKPQGNVGITKPVVESGKEKSGVKPVEKESGNKVDEKQMDKKPQGNAVTTTPVVELEKDKTTEKPIDKSTIFRDVRTLTRIVEKELERIMNSGNKLRNQEINKQFLSRDNLASVDNREMNQEILKANLSGRLVEVSFEKGSVSAEKLYVEPLADSSLIQLISNKLGNQYNIIETFEIHFEKNNKKVDSNIERKVKVAVVKKDNYDLEVYHISEDKKLEKIDSIYTEGIITFKTNHFSKFTIVEKINIGTKDLEERTKIEVPEKDKNSTINEELPKTNSYKLKLEKKILPKTGATSMSLEIFGVGMILLAYFIRKKQII